MFLSSICKGNRSPDARVGFDERLSKVVWQIAGRMPKFWYLGLLKRTSLNRPRRCVEFASEFSQHSHFPCGRHELIFFRQDRAMPPCYFHPGISSRLSACKLVEMDGVTR